MIWRSERGYMDGRGLALSSMGGVYFGRFVEGRWCRRYLLRWSPYAGEVFWGMEYAKIEVQSALSWEVASGHENGSTEASYVKANVRIHFWFDSTSMYLKYNLVRHPAIKDCKRLCRRLLPLMWQVRLCQEYMQKLTSEFSHQHADVATGKWSDETTPDATPDDLHVNPTSSLCHCLSPLFVIG